MDEILFESKRVFDTITVFQNRVQVISKMWFWGDTYTLSISEIASINKKLGKPIEILTTGGSIYKVLIPKKQTQEFINTVMKLKAKSQN